MVVFRAQTLMDRDQRRTRENMKWVLDEGRQEVRIRLGCAGCYREEGVRAYVSSV